MQSPEKEERFINLSKYILWMKNENYVILYRKYKGEDSKLVGVMKEELATDLIADLQTHVNNDDYWTKPITQKEPMQQIKKGIEKILIEEK